MEKEWKMYYSEMFRTYTSEFFVKLWGDYLDEWGEEYEDIYKYELEGMKDKFSGFMYVFNKYNLEYDKSAIALFILNMFESLGGCENPVGAFDMADMILFALKRRIGFNHVWHPEGRPV